MVLKHDKVFFLKIEKLSDGWELEKGGVAF